MKYHALKLVIVFVWNNHGINFIYNNEFSWEFIWNEILCLMYMVKVRIWIGFQINIIFLNLVPNKDGRRESTPVWSMVVNDGQLWYGQPCSATIVGNNGRWRRLQHENHYADDGGFFIVGEKFISILVKIDENWFCINLVIIKS